MPFWTGWRAIRLTAAGKWRGMANLCVVSLSGCSTGESQCFSGANALSLCWAAGFEFLPFRAAPRKERSLCVFPPVLAPSQTSLGTALCSSSLLSNQNKAQSTYTQRDVIKLNFNHRWKARGEKSAIKRGGNVVAGLISSLHGLVLFYQGLWLLFRASKWASVCFASSDQENVDVSGAGII